MKIFVRCCFTLILMSPFCFGQTKPEIKDRSDISEISAGFFPLIKKMLNVEFDLPAPTVKQTRLPRTMPALHDYESGTTYVTDSFNLQNDFDMSILFHETVHYVQKQTNRFPEIESQCLRDRQWEIEAYSLQTQYLLHIGSSQKVKFEHRVPCR